LWRCTQTGESTGSSRGRHRSHLDKLETFGMLGVQGSSFLESYRRPCIGSALAPRRCGHCKAAAPEVKKAAKALKGVANVGVVDGDKAQAIAQKLGVQGFPTFKLIVDGKATDYNGARDANGMVSAVMGEVQSLVRARMGGKATGGSGSKAGSGSKPSGGSGGGGNANAPGGGKHVITGTAANFEEEVLGSSDPVLVEFYAPWCGHCKTLAAPLAEAAEELHGEVKIVAVDATEHASIASEFGVRGYPTLKFFPPGKKSRASAQDYNGGRDKEGIVSAVRAMTEAAGGAASGSAAQLTGEKAWADHCAGKRVCVVAVLPGLLDESAARRAERLEGLAEAAGKVGKRSIFRFLWTEVGAQPGLEQSLGVGMVPAVYAVSVDKKVFTPYRGSLEPAALAKWVNSLAVRNQGAAPFPGGALPKIAAAAEWDGKDAPAPAATEEDSLSLEELGL